MTTMAAAKVAAIFLLKISRTVYKYSILFSPHEAFAKNAESLTVDRLSKSNRSALMARVKTKNTSPEITVRSMLHRLGYRFRLHKKDLPGSPDIVLASHQKVIFVHGCFWHGHSCKRGELPASNRIFWETKIARNQSRDLSTARKLRDAGWSVSTVWECQTKDTAKLENRLAKLMTK